MRNMYRSLRNLHPRSSFSSSSSPSAATTVASPFHRTILSCRNRPFSSTAHSLPSSSTPSCSPSSPSKPYFVTTPIYYVNSSPHVGHLYTSLVADAGARYQALKHGTLLPTVPHPSPPSIPSSSSPVLFSTGTDEHGQKVAEAAAKAGKPVESFCDQISAEFTTLHHQFSIIPTTFIRTTDIAHYMVVQWLWRKLEQRGYIYVGDHEGWYCQSDETFLSDSQIMTRKEYLIEKNLYVPPPTPEELAKQEKIERNKQRKLQHKLEKKALKEQQQQQQAASPESSLSSTTNNRTATNTVEQTITDHSSSSSTKYPSSTSPPPSPSPSSSPPSPIKTDWTEAELQAKVSSESGHPVERIKETNYLFRLTAFRDELNQLFTTPIPSTVHDQHHTHTFQYKFIEPESRAINVHNYVNSDGFKDLSISRRKDRVPWAIPVPVPVSTGPATTDHPGNVNRPSEPHSIYVWLDALANYLTVAAKDSAWYTQLQKDIATYRQHQPPHTNSASSSLSLHNFPLPVLPLDAPWATLFPHWPADIHIVGKDILKFHAVYWPAFCIGAGLPPPKRILAHGHWTVEKVKMSKSLGNVVVPSSLLQENGGNYTVDSIRYFLLREGRLDSDGDYSSQVLSQRCAKECSDTFGNLVNRILNKLFMPAGTPVLDPRRRLLLPYERLGQYNIRPLERGKIFHPHPSAANLAKEDDAMKPSGTTNTKEDTQTLIFNYGQYELLGEMLRIHPQIVQAYEAFEFHKGLEILTGILQLTNKVYSDSAPWKLKPSNEDAEEWYRIIQHGNEGITNTESSAGAPLKLLTEDNLKLAGTLYSLLEVLRMTGIYLLPIMPSVAPRLLSSMNFTPVATHPFASWKSVYPCIVYPHEYRIRIDQSTILFPKPPSLDNPLGLTRKQAKRLEKATAAKEGTTGTQRRTNVECSEK